VTGTGPVRPAPLVHRLDEDLGSRPAEEQRTLLGAKGATLVALTAMCLPVPPGFVLTTGAFRRFTASGWDEELEAALRHGLAGLEQATGRRLGDPEAPLLVSVRGGAPVSMPGILDTVLDVGVTPAVAEALGRESAAFATDTRARAVRSWAVASDGEPPEDPHDQLRAAVVAVMGSWDAERVRRYRQLEGIPDDLGTAVTVQAMVFGNRSDRSGTAVAFTRDPSTGAPGLMGDFLPGVQGDDVVSGSQPTRPLEEVRHRWPAVWDELVALCARLEVHFADAVDVELTIEEGELWVLQARPAPRSPRAAVRIAVDLAEDPAVPLDRAGAVARCRHLVDGHDWGSSGEGDEGAATVATGLGASPGRAVGVLCVDPTVVEALAADGMDVVLAQRETAPADVPAMAAAVGLVTTMGGLVSHTAVVAREWGVPAVVGAAELEVHADGVEGPGGPVAVGEVVTVDGDGGRLLRGAHPGSPAGEPPELAVLRRWAAELA